MVPLRREVGVHSCSVGWSLGVRAVLRQVLKAWVSDMRRWLRFVARLRPPFCPCICGLMGTSLTGSLGETCSCPV